MKKKKMLFKKKSLNSKEYLELKKQIAIIEIDMALITDRLTKAITKKAIKKTEKPEEPTEEDFKNAQILPI